MTLHQLEYAVTLARHRSFKKAAENLQISQPALSMQIRKLEESAGLCLFDRTGVPLQTTPDGKRFLDRAREILQSVQSLKNFARDLHDDFNGQIRVGIIPTLAPYLVPLFAESLQNDFPGYKLDIREEITEKVVAGVRSGDLDAGIISTPINAYGIHAIPILYEKFFVYTSDQNTDEQPTVSLDTIDYTKLWLLEEGNCFRDQVNNFCDLNEIRKHRSFIYRSHSIDALIRLVDRKGGMTILPELSTLSLSADQESFVKEISGTPRAREISIIVTKSNIEDRYIALLEQYIRSNVPHSMLKKEGLAIVDPEIDL